MRVALLQCQSRPLDVTGNLLRLREGARRAAAEGAQILVCPEMFLSGYAIGAPAVRQLAEPADGESFRQVAAIASAANLAIVYGYPEIAPQGQLFNSVQFVAPTGSSLGNYRKTHLYGELDNAQFSRSEQLPELLDFDGWKIGLLICYDIEFPEAARYLASQGADLILVPTANMEPYRFVPQVVVPCRAYENQVYVAYANFCGEENQLTYCGLSSIVSPSGVALDQAGDRDCLVLASLDREALAISRRAMPFLADRRTDLF